MRPNDLDTNLFVRGDRGTEIETTTTKEVKGSEPIGQDLWSPEI